MSIFAQFRAGILPLQVEVWRFRNVLLGELTCTLCNQGDVEDEYHVLCVCTKYNDIRVALYKKAESQLASFNSIDNIEKFVYLVNNQQAHVIKFLVNALYRRSASLYC